MNKWINIQAGFLLVILITSMSCQQQKENQSTVDSKKASIKPNESGYADVNGLKLYYEVYGSGDPIVLLHGSYMTIPLNWTSFIPPLAKNRKVIVAEMQGHGRTRDIEREFTYEGMADDVSGLLKHLKIDSADILGYSMGGGIAFQFAVRHPEQLRKLVIMSGTYSHDGWWPELEALWPQTNAEMFRGTAIEKQYDSLGNDPAKFDEYVKKVISPDMKPYDWTDDVKKIKSPIFIVLGDVDGVRYEHALELFRTLGGGKTGDMMPTLPQSRLAIIPGTTHVGMINREEWLVPMIEDFLDATGNTQPPTF